MLQLILELLDGLLISLEQVLWLDVAARIELLLHPEENAALYVCFQPGRGFLGTKLPHCGFGHLIHFASYWTQMVGSGPMDGLNCLVVHQYYVLV